jgi:hypothetical protein
MIRAGGAARIGMIGTAGNPAGLEQLGALVMVGRVRPWRSATAQIVEREPHLQRRKSSTPSSRQIHPKS